ncbi:MAG: FecR domain-containing protein [Elusimicrobiales bacterium]
MKTLLILFVFCFPVFGQNDINQYKKMLDQALKMQESQNASSGAMDIRIERIGGNVKVITSYEEEADLTDNYQYPLEAGDTIKTGYDGYANIYINNIGVIRLERNTEMEITEPSNDMVFSLFLGSVVSKMESLNKSKMSLKIKTPSALVAVRGTEFAAEYSKFQDETSAAVFDEGEVVLYPGENEDEAKAIKITKNSETSLTSSSKRVKVTKLSKFLKYKRSLTEAKKNLIAHKKKWKKFDNEHRQKFREALFKKNVGQTKQKKQNIKNTGALKK